MFQQPSQSPFSAPPPSLPSPPVFTPIGKSNPQNPDQRVMFDRGHGDLPDHVDMVVPIRGLGAHKIRVNGSGDIISDDIV